MECTLWPVRVMTLDFRSESCGGRIGWAMAEAVARQLRDGVAIGEQAPAVMVRDTVDTRAGPAIFDHLLSSLCSNIGAGRAQAK